MTPDVVAEGRRLLNAARAEAKRHERELTYEPGLRDRVSFEAREAVERWAVNHLDMLLTLAEAAQQDGAA